MSSHIIGTVFTRIVVPNLSGNKDWFCGRVFPWIVGGVDGFRVIQIHYICVYFLLLLHQFHPEIIRHYWGWRPLLWDVVGFLLSQVMM